MAARERALGEAGQKVLLDSIALRCLGTPEDIARAVRFFWNTSFSTLKPMWFALLP